MSKIMTYLQYGQVSTILLNLMVQLNRSGWIKFGKKLTRDSPSQTIDNSDIKPV